MKELNIKEMFAFSSLVYFFLFLFGLVVGSFLNCLIYRLETGKSFLKGRSFCPQCQHLLSWSDLIPILSFLILRGKCRYCQQPISWQYPLLELFSGILFLLTAVFNLSFSTFSFKILFQLISQYFVISTFLIIFVYDLKHYLIPEKIIYSAIFVMGICYLVFLFLGYYTIYDIRNAILSAFGAAGFFLLIYLISKGKWMGFGDVNLSFLMGFFLGWPKILVALILAFFIGAIFGLSLVISGKKTMKSEIPFAPFLVTGTFLTIFFGQKIISWYLKFFLI